MDIVNLAGLAADENYAAENFCNQLVNSWGNDSIFCSLDEDGNYFTFDNLVTSSAIISFGYFILKKIIG